ncbi:helix-turn-helix domain-containing protein [Xenorhabdus bovienii]|uniref:S24 family peptidase n=1 Tax=Xenorhabdus bovienii TaxID=40576 RepID=UPI0023B20732|nr:S24 family peptidase [Xenorhabdus bovienii]MDE9483265.1 helix-turn-helix domain-containing protein [Xenorhabdus bovienii]MDE9552767.1 helix-turn-helix domain-containing protein [Xenorhabdus bovienii]MDE9557337.1 helix-turn-helix domain-containing protein [Xenorhabdus bovienii]
MQFDESFPKRLVSARNAVGLTQVNLASKAETVVRQIAAYEAGDARPRLKTLKKIASALGTTEEWLCVGIGEAPSAESFSRVRNINQIPILNDGSIGDFLSRNYIAQGTKLHPCEMDVSDKAFAYVVRGESMTAAIPGSLSLPDGTIVTVDPDSRFSSGNIALISQDNYLIRVKKVVIVKDQATIISLNTFEYPSELCNLSDIEFIYPVIKAEIYLGDKYNTELTSIPRWDSWESGISRSVIFEDRQTSINSDKRELNERLDKLESMLEQLLNKKAL